MAYGIVSEFNPFHNGHRLLIDKSDDITVSVTSSSFVQRGDVSFINKADKTKAALKYGVDIVLELPAVYSLANAEVFARSSVEILRSVGIVDKLLFGSECGDVNLLKYSISILKNTTVQEKIKEYMEGGLYYPKAVYNAVKEIYNEETAKVFSGANNVLAIEYIKALEGSTIEPVTLKRVGSGHDSKTVYNNIASGSYIRENFSEKELYAPDYTITDIAKIENIEKLIVYKFSNMTDEQIKNLPDVGEGIENRIVAAVKNYNTFLEICNAVKTKRYTMARIRRILCCGLLSITKDLQQSSVPYVRILGFTDRGKQYLKEIRSNCKIPVIINLCSDYNKLSEVGKKFINTEIIATRLWSLASANNTILKNDFSQPIIKNNPTV